MVVVEVSFVKIFIFYHLFSLFKTKTLTNNSNTKHFYKHKNSFHLLVTLEKIFKQKTLSKAH